jgi:cytochrome c-type biogenesis protein CcsB
MLLANLFNLDLFENSLRNATFLTLFFTTILYWIDTAFSNPSNHGQHQLPIKSIGADPLNKGVFNTSYEYTSSNDDDGRRPHSPTYVGEVCNKQSLSNLFNGASQSLDGLITNGMPTNLFNWSVMPTWSMAISNLLLVLLLLVRWEKSGHFPLSNLYESLMFLAWCCTFLYLMYVPKNKSILSFDPPSVLKREMLPRNLSIGMVIPNQYNSIFQKKLLGSIIAPCALLMNAFATFSLPKEMQQSAPLVPALQSNWLMMHVTVMIISYAALIIGSLLSILFLILNLIQNNKDKGSPLPFGKRVIHRRTTMYDPVTGSTSSALLTNLMDLDLLSYRIIGLGFPFLTIGILSGAVWANEAWGSYWSWDPKETWALLTWLVFAIYLHTRLTKGWQGEKPAFIATIGFMVVWFCYLGVNLIGEGLHSYGFFKL